MISNGRCRGLIQRNRQWRRTGYRSSKSFQAAIPNGYELAHREEGGLGRAASTHSWVREQKARKTDLKDTADTLAQFILDQPPLPIGLQTAAEPIMLWTGRRALSYQPVIEGLALLAVSREFPEERYLAGILRLRIAPFSGGADRLAVYLLVHSVTDNV